MRLQREQLVKLLSDLGRRGATELHLKVGSPPALRIRGKLTRLDGRSLAASDTQAAAFALCNLAGRKNAITEDAEFDFTLDDGLCFRAFLFMQRGVQTAVVHTVATSIPTLRDLDVSLSLPKLMAEGGLWLLCGRQRETLLAALVQEQARTHTGHTVVLEQEAGFPYGDGIGLLSVRRLGHDVPDLASGIRTSRRMGADLLVTGDVRDRDAAEQVLEAVESGLPTIASMGFARAADLVSGFARLFEVERRDEIEARVSARLQEVLAFPNEAADIRRAARTSEDPPPLPRSFLVD